MIEVADVLEVAAGVEAVTEDPVIVMTETVIMAVTMSDETIALVTLILGILIFVIIILVGVLSPFGVMKLRWRGRD